MSATRTSDIAVGLTSAASPAFPLCRAPPLLFAGDDERGCPSDFVAPRRFMAWTGGGSAAVVAAGLTTGLTGFSFVSSRTGTVFTLTDVGAWSGHQRALKLRASKGMTRTPSLTTGAGGAVSRLRGHVRRRIAG